MFGKSFMDRIKDAQKEHEIAYVSYYNDGTNSKEEYGEKERLDDEIIFPVQVKRIMSQFCEAVESYSNQFDYDTVCMNLKLGLLYDINDLDENEVLKPNAKPIKNMVRYYSGPINSYLDGNQTNTRDFNEYHWGIQGFVNYNRLVSAIKKGGVDFIGPESFEEFKKAIIDGKQFDIIISAYLDNKKDHINVKR